MKKLSSILWGLVLIAVGVIFALNAFGVTDIDVFFDGWWTLFIIVPCAIGLFSERDKMGNLIGLCIGAFLLLCCQDILEFDMLWKLAVPVIIILIGVKMIFGGIFDVKRAEVKKKMKENGEALKSYCATFSGQNINFDGELFTGAELVAVFGGIKCDLSRAVFENECIIEVSAIFGGVDIILPSGVNVKLNSNSIFGGISNKKYQNDKNNTVTVYINGTCIFGGVEIK